MLFRSSSTAGSDSSKPRAETETYDEGKRSRSNMKYGILVRKIHQYPGIQRLVKKNRSELLFNFFENSADKKERFSILSTASK